MRKFTVLSVCIALVFCVSLASYAIASDEDDVLQVPINWVKAFSNGDFEAFSSLYLHSPNTSEYSPVNGYPFLYQGWDLLEADWKSSFASLPKGALSFTLHHPQATLIGKDAAVTTAYQIAVYTDPETKEQNIGQLRQTLVLQKVNGKWLIVHDHTSELPTE